MTVAQAYRTFFQFPDGEEVSTRHHWELNQRRDVGLQRLLHEAFPVVGRGGHAEVRLAGYHLEPPDRNAHECVGRAASFCWRLHLAVEIVEPSAGGRRGRAANHRAGTVRFGLIPAVDDHGFTVLSGKRHRLSDQLEAGSLHQALTAAWLRAMSELRADILDQLGTVSHALSWIRLHEVVRHRVVRRKLQTLLFGDELWMRADETDSELPNDRLTDIRGILYRGASRRTWDVLCEALDGWATDGSLEVALDYIESHIQPWDDEIRVAPRRWWNVVAAGGREPRFRIAKTLDLAAMGGGEPAVAAIVQQGLLAGLTRVDLAHNKLTRAAAAAIAQTPTLSGLIHLDLGLNQLGDQGLVELGRSEHLGELRSLDLTSNTIGAQGLRGFFHRKATPKLSSLVLWGNDVGDEGTEVLSVEAPASLTALDLARNGVTGEGVEILLTGERLRLTALGLSGNQIDDEGAATIANCRRAASLTSLDLSGNPITEIGRAALAQSPWLAPGVWWV